MGKLNRAAAAAGRGAARGDGWRGDYQRGDWWRAAGRPRRKRTGSWSRSDPGLVSRCS